MNTTTERLIRQKLPDWPRLIGSSLCGEKQLCHVIELFESWNPKPTSFLSQCSVWEASVTNHSKLGKAGSIVFWKHAVSKLWIESTGSQWSSGGQNFSGFTTLRILDENQKMMTESQCEPEQYSDADWWKRGNREHVIATSFKITEYARRFPQRRWSFLGLDPRINGTEPMPTKPDGEMGRKEISPFTSTELKNPLINTLHCYFCQSAQYLRSSSRFVSRISQKPTRYGAIRRDWEFGIHDCTDRISYCKPYFSDWCRCTGNLVAQLRTEIRRTSWTAEIDQTMLRPWFLEECWKRTILHYTWWRRRTRRTEEFMSRVLVSEIRRSARSWMWRSGFIKDVTVLRSWSNLYFRDRTVSLFRIVNGIIKYVTETWEEICNASAEHGCTGKLVAKVKPRPKPNLTLALVSIPKRHSRNMIRLLRHDETILREEDGAVRFDAVAEKFMARLDGTSRWSVAAWITCLEKRRRTEEEVSLLLNLPNIFL